MQFEPQKFFIGLVDFFSILMPGALVAYLCKDRAAQALLGETGFSLNGTEAWMVFLFASYLLGHFLFLLGAVLDDWLYDPLRRCTYWGQIGRLAKAKGVRAQVWRSLAARLFGANADAAVMQVQWIKARALQPISAEGAINAFQWSKARLSEDHAAGLLAVQRFEADSKFFRSFVVVLALLAFAFSLQHRRNAALICVGFLALALWRYVDQRFKATQQAYWFVVTLEGMKDPGSPVAHPQRKDELTHAGGVVFRKLGETVECLLVEASKNRIEWVLPKGHIETGEDPRETAVREVKEETGQWARIVDWIDDVRFEAASERPLVRVFLMEAIDDTALWRKSWRWVKKAVFKKSTGEAKKRRPEDRQSLWLPLSDAKVKAAFPETRMLLEMAEKKPACRVL